MGGTGEGRNGVPNCETGEENIFQTRTEQSVPNDWWTVGLASCDGDGDGEKYLSIRSGSGRVHVTTCTQCHSAVTVHRNAPRGGERRPKLLKINSIFSVWHSERVSRLKLDDWLRATKTDDGKTCGRSHVTGPAQWN